MPHGSKPPHAKRPSLKPKPRGCFIEIWRGSNFEGDSFRFEGPGEFPALRADWSDEASSLRVGPEAFVLAYADKNFEGRAIGFLPNQEVADLRKLRFDDEIDSMQVIDSIRIFERPPSESEIERVGRTAASSATLLPEQGESDRQGTAPRRLRSRRRRR